MFSWLPLKPTNGVKSKPQRSSKAESKPEKPASQPSALLAQPVSKLPTEQAKGGIWHGVYGNWQDAMPKPVPPKTAVSVSVSREIDPVLLLRRSDERLKKPQTNGGAWLGVSIDKRFGRPNPNKD